MLPYAVAAPPRARGFFLVRGLLLVGVLLGAGCREVPRAQLVDLERVEHTGDGGFVLYGHGFPTDRRADIELRGVVHRPGHGASPLEVTLPGAAETAERLPFSADSHPVLSTLSPGQFEGSLAVAFAAGTTEVRGRLPSVQLTLRSGQAGARRDALQAARRGAQWLASLGAVELELDLDRAGVRVGGVEQGGVADLAGLAPGDRIVALDGASVADLADLWPAPGAEPVGLRVERGAASREVEISLPRAREQRLRAEPPTQWLGALGLLGLGLLLLWPSARASVQVPQLHAPLSTGALALMVALGGASLQLGSGAVHVLRGAVPCALAFVCVPALLPRARRLEALTRAACQLPVACVALACAGLLAGTLSPSLGDPSRSGDWPLLVQPPGWCLLTMVHVALRSEERDPVQRAVVAGARGTLTTALVALLGGADLAWGGGPLASLALTSLTAWLSLEWIVARRVFPFAGLATAALLGPAVAFAWFLGAPAQPVTATASALTPWLLAALCARASWLRLKSHLWPAPALDPQLSPFL